MKKTINVTIGGLVFSIEEDGYHILNTYLESLKTHFASVSYGSEVIADIESRIAEQFNAKIAGNAQRAVTSADVEAVLKSIGTVEDFDTTGNTKTETPASGAKKLYRSSDDVMIAGVASGIAAYFGWDVTLVRVIFAVIVLAGGWGIPLYVLLWLLLPEAKSAGQKLEMKGAPVTIKQIEQTAKEKISEAKASGLGRKISNVIGFIIKMFVRFILAVIGISLTFSAAVGAFAVTFATANLLFNRNSPYVDFPFAGVFHGALYLLAIFLVFVIVVVPLIYLALAGITLMRMKKPPINGMLASVLSILWVAAVIVAGVVTLNKYPAIQSAVSDYRGSVETRTLDVKDFTQLDASNAYRVIITPGKTYAVTVTGHTHDLDTSKFEVVDGTLNVGRKDNFIKICFFCFDLGGEATLNITMPTLDGIRGSGATNYTVGKFNNSDFKIDLSGASRAAISDLSSSNTFVELSGASHLILSGNGKTLSADLSGASHLEGFDFKVQDAKLKASGASHLDTSVANTLDAHASGASTIFYRGKPNITNQDESGASHIRPE